MPKADVVKRINQRWSDRAGGAVLGVNSTESSAPTGGVDIRVAGNSINRMGNRILRFGAAGILLSDYAWSASGLASALEASYSGDVVELPAGELESDADVPEGVSLRGRGWSSVITGAVTLNDGSMLEHLSIGQLASSSDDIVGITGPSSGTAIARDVQVLVQQLGSGKALGALVSGGTLRTYGCEIWAQSAADAWATGASGTGTVELNQGQVQAKQVASGGTLIIVTEIYTTDGGEIYRSIDNGATWSLVHSTSSGQGFWDVATDNAGIWCATHENAIYRSTNDGLTWTAIFTGGDTLYNIATDCNGVWCATDGDSIVWRSTDDGENWAEVLNDQAGDYAEFGPIATDRAGNWLMCEYNSSSSNWVWKSTDNGANWVHASEITLVPDRALYCIATDRAGVWIVGTRSGASATAPIMRSTNLGTSWTNVQELSVSDIDRLATDCDGIWCAGTYNEGKIFRSTDDGVTWTEVYDPTSSDSIAGDALCTDETGNWWMGCWQKAEIHQSDDDGENWEQTGSLYPDSLYPHAMTVSSASGSESVLDPFPGPTDTIDPTGTSPITLDGTVNAQAVSMPDYADDVRGEPLAGDRGAFLVDTEAHAKLHASDILGEAPTRHNPEPGAANNLLMSDGSKWTNSRDIDVDTINVVTELSSPSSDPDEWMTLVNDDGVMLAERTNDGGDYAGFRMALFDGDGDPQVAGSMTLSWPGGAANTNLFLICRKPSELDGVISDNHVVLAAIDDVLSYDTRIDIDAQERLVDIGGSAVIVEDVNKANARVLIKNALVVVRNSTNYTGYIYIPLAANLKAAAFDGDSFSDVSWTKIDTSSVFSAPAGIKAAMVRLEARDSATWGTSGLYARVGPNGSATSFEVRPAGGDVWAEVVGVCPCNADGDFYYDINASGSNTLDLYIEIMGYYI